LFVRELVKDEDDTDMDRDTVWQNTVDLTDAIVASKEISLDEEVDEDDDDFLETATPRFESLKVSDDDASIKKSSTLKRKRVGEDVFTREFVKTWQGSRIKAWESRYLVSCIKIDETDNENLPCIRVQKGFIIDSLFQVRDNETEDGLQKNMFCL
jgi:hypothetical protein